MKNKTPKATADAGGRQAVVVNKPARAKAVATRQSAKPRGQSAGQPAVERKHEPRKRGAGAGAGRGKSKLSKPSKKLEVRLLIDDLARIDALKQRAAAAGRRSKRSELLRAGLVLLQGLDPLSLCDVLEALPVRRKDKSLPVPSLITAGGKPAKR